jgi:hypothetical protein
VHGSGVALRYLGPEFRNPGIYEARARNDEVFLARLHSGKAPLRGESPEHGVTSTKLAARSSRPSSCPLRVSDGTMWIGRRPRRRAPQRILVAEFSLQSGSAAGVFQSLDASSHFHFAVLAHSPMSRRNDSNRVA